eukprot:TRINITY_DN24740_c0_g1_i1.p1 TRINITY_DN24740_c0_g1~~TRINITY_DN24740_c0_g1_i1.p1  ORF type:complete len:1585 (-),score=410.87 TRINITY_DN24740_c0_g1_i1:129-4883(-)
MDRQQSLEKAEACSTEETVMILEFANRLQDFHLESRQAVQGHVAFQEKLEDAFQVLLLKERHKMIQPLDVGMVEELKQEGKKVTRDVFAEALSLQKPHEDLAGIYIDVFYRRVCLPLLPLHHLVGIAGKVEAAHDALRRLIREGLFMNLCEMLEASMRVNYFASENRTLIADIIFNIIMFDEFHPNASEDFKSRVSVPEADRIRFIVLLSSNFPDDVEDDDIFSLALTMLVTGMYIVSSVNEEESGSGSSSRSGSTAFQKKVDADCMRDEMWRHALAYGVMHLACIRESGGRMIRSHLEKGLTTESLDFLLRTILQHPNLKKVEKAVFKIGVIHLVLCNCLLVQESRRELLSRDNLNVFLSVFIPCLCECNVQFPVFSRLFFQSEELNLMLRRDLPELMAYTETPSEVKIPLLHLLESLSHSEFGAAHCLELLDRDDTSGALHLTSFVSGPLVEYQRSVQFGQPAAHEEIQAYLSLLYQCCKHSYSVSCAFRMIPYFRDVLFELVLLNIPHEVMGSCFSLLSVTDGEAEEESTGFVDRLFALIGSDQSVHRIHEILEKVEIPMQDFSCTLGILRIICGLASVRDVSCFVPFVVQDILARVADWSPKQSQKDDIVLTGFLVLAEIVSRKHSGWKTVLSDFSKRSMMPFKILLNTLVDDKSSDPMILGALTMFVSLVDSSVFVHEADVEANQRQLRGEMFQNSAVIQKLAEWIGHDSCPQIRFMSSRVLSFLAIPDEGNKLLNALECLPSPTRTQMIIGEQLLRGVRDDTCVYVHAATSRERRELSEADMLAYFHEKELSEILTNLILRGKEWSSSSSLTNLGRFLCGLTANGAGVLDVCGIVAVCENIFSAARMGTVDEIDIMASKVLRAAINDRVMHVHAYSLILQWNIPEILADGMRGRDLGMRDCLHLGVMLHAIATCVYQSNPNVSAESDFVRSSVERFFFIRRGSSVFLDACRRIVMFLESRPGTTIAEISRGQTFSDKDVQDPKGYFSLPKLFAMCGKHHIVDNQELVQTAREWNRYFDFVDSSAGVLNFLDTVLLAILSKDFENDYWVMLFDILVRWYACVAESPILRGRRVFKRLARSLHLLLNYLGSRAKEQQDRAFIAVSVQATLMPYLVQTSRVFGAFIPLLPLLVQHEIISLREFDAGFAASVVDYAVSGTFSEKICGYGAVAEILLRDMDQVKEFTLFSLERCVDDWISVCNGDLQRLLDRDIDGNPDAALVVTSQISFLSQIASTKEGTSLLGELSILARVEELEFLDHKRFAEVADVHVPRKEDEHFKIWMRLVHQFLDLVNCVVLNADDKARVHILRSAFSMQRLRKTMLFVLRSDVEMVGVPVKKAAFSILNVIITFFKGGVRGPEGLFGPSLQKFQDCCTRALSNRQLELHTGGTLMIELLSPRVELFCHVIRILFELTSKPFEVEACHRVLFAPSLSGFSDESGDLSAGMAPSLGILMLFVKKTVDLLVQVRDVLAEVFKGNIPEVSIVQEEKESVILSPTMSLNDIFAHLLVMCEQSLCVMWRHLRYFRSHEGMDAGGYSSISMLEFCRSVNESLRNTYDIVQTQFCHRSAVMSSLVQHITALER